MKKAFYLLLSSIFILNVFSCTPQAVENIEAPQACCGDDFPIPPPPPPPIGG